ncbi:MAG: proteasome subunit beta [Candidatus Micrarchaeota archaeon]|nr:proteasome subunit beta [Candidatus Micrarchaeota archaeon]MDE1833748.1 proteasome subunit beta [Candidatus Micrarchaeota archaeon]MDE1859426.1 proteasome subunit beta [Candidatus Micrarchaeota archaeon]
MVDRDFYEAIKKGTTTIGIVCSDGVAMGSDARATMDTFISSSEAVKIHRINDGLAMTIAGGVGDAEYLVKMIRLQDELYSMEEKKSLTPTSATSILSIILQENKMFPFLVQLVLGGINKNAYEIYNIDPVGGYTKESRFTATGSGSLTALGYIEGIYDPSMTVQEAAKHVAKALRIAMKRDSATGDGTRVVTITKKGFKEYTKEEIDKLSK